MFLVLPDGYSTKVGELGAQLSGGQRQRIGIARAFYKKARLLVLYEATSALDNDTESAIIDSIIKNQDNVTNIMIAHRLTTLSNCNKILELSGGRLERCMTYDDVINR